jgi:hypothetical protein
MIQFAIGIAVLHRRAIYRKNVLEGRLHLEREVWITFPTISITHPRWRIVC